MASVHIGEIRENDDDIYVLPHSRTNLFSFLNRPTIVFNPNLVYLGYFCFVCSLCVCVCVCFLTT